MPVSLTRQSSYSSRSISSGGALNLSDGLQSAGSGQRRMSLSGSVSSRAPSVYGGAGGFGTRISQSVYTAGPRGETAVVTNEKVTMQNLNDRLSSYLQKVRTLEGANRKLELQIREYYEKKTASLVVDHTEFFDTISGLRTQLLRKHAENQSLLLQIDNAQLAADDFRMKYETELNMRMMVEADVTRLRGVRDGLTIAITDVEAQIEALKEELAHLKYNHKEEVRLMKSQQSGAVNVEVDSTESVDLTKVLQEVREQYETMVQKNKLEVEKWFQSKVDTLQSKIVSHKTEVKVSHTELTEVKKTYQTLEINMQSVLSEILCLEQNLEELKERYGAQLRHLQETINRLEVELQHVRGSVEHQQSEYNILLDLKMRLEMEIAEYRRLLEGEDNRTVIISKVVEVKEEPKPHVERRVKIITEELVDGVVVSSTSDTKVEEVQ